MPYPVSTDVPHEEWRREMEEMMDRKLEKKTKEQDKKIAAGAEEYKKLKEKMAAVEEENEKLKEKMAAVEQGNEKLKEIIVKNMNTEALYGYFEGDEYFYMKLEKLIPLLEKCCNGNEKKMKELDEWKQDVKKKAGKRYWNCLGGSALAGAGAGVGSVIYLGGKTLTTITGLSVLPALGVVVAAFAAGGAAIFFVTYGITKKYRENEAEKKVREYDGSAEIAEEIRKTSGRGKKPMTAAISGPLGSVNFKCTLGN